MQTQIGQAAEERERGKRESEQGGEAVKNSFAFRNLNATPHRIASHRIRTAAKLTTVITFSTRHFSFRLLGISHAAKTFRLPLPVITFCHHFFFLCFFVAQVTNMPKTERGGEEERERERRGSHCNLNCQCAQPSRGQRGQHSVGK